MRDAIADSAIVEFIRDLFSGSNATTSSMFRWMLVAWLVAVVGMIVLDRVGASLLGKSRPLSQRPPAQARTWRWRRHAPPPTYSLLPSGTMITAPPPPAAKSIPLASSSPTEAPDGDDDRVIAWHVPSADIPDSYFWESLASGTSPVFGLENNDRLTLGRAPERYNPVTDEIEELLRLEDTLRWPYDVDSSLTVDVDGLDDSS